MTGYTSVRAAVAADADPVPAPRAVPTPPLPVSGDLLAARDFSYLDVVARMASGLTPAATSADLRLLAATLATRHLDNDAGRGLMLAAGALACYLPARRAMHIDPVIALRAD